ncbi:MAG: hypothetical protein KA354_16095, partial [Phycisphaerae bacterium]|nr:hypothetical protein [Phycisphaerae bacterium]
YYYFRLEAAANSPSGLDDGTGWFWIMIDTNPAVAQWTGWNSTNSTDYIFQGPLIDSWGTSWDQVAFPPSPLAVEGAVLRSDMGDPAAVNLVFVGENGPDFYPDGAFSADYFHYTVHPPSPTGGEPIEVYTLSNKVANGAISIDGSFSDWSSLTFFPEDAAGDGGPDQDWLRASIAHDDNNLYLMVERTPESTEFQGGLGQGYWIILDTDRDKATGFTGFGARSFSIGGEYNWGGLASNAWSSNGCYDHNVPMTMPPQDYEEFSFPRSTFINPENFTFIFEGETSHDYYPDSASTEGKVLHYYTGALPDPLPGNIAESRSNSVTDGTMRVDGQLADWANITPYTADPIGDALAASEDWVQVWVAHDSANFYFLVKRAPGSLPFTALGYWTVIDTDFNPATGQKGAWAPAVIGAEINTNGTQGHNLWAPDAGGGLVAGGLPLPAAATGPIQTSIESSIPLSELGNPTRFRVIYVGENSGDYYPNGANADKTFLYTFRPCHKPFADADGDGDVDQLDFSAWQLCYSGNGTATVDSCLCFDRDYGDQGDGDIDSSDLLAFVNCFSGPMVPASTECE